MTDYSFRILPSTVNSERVYRVDTNSNRTADDSDPILIHQTDAGWKPVTTLDQPVDRFSVEQDYGYWGDKEISHNEGWPWNRHKVVDRPVDGQIQPDEISSNGFRRLGNSTTFELGGEISKDAQGRFFLNEKFEEYGPLRIITAQDIRDMEAMRQNDGNWNVPAQSHTA